jgi:hypothetical protein
MIAVDITGQRFGRLIALNRVSASRSSWECLCDCGNTKIILLYSLRSGSTKSCGCYSAGLTANLNKTHGMSNTPTHRVWKGMRQRCLNKKIKEFRYWGGRGITICDRWKTFTNFLMDMGEKPVGKSLDRYPDGGGNYEPGNCRWATPEEQALNRTSNLYIHWKGKTQTAMEWALEIGLPYTCLIQRISVYKWPVERALAQPLRGTR